MKNEKLDVAIVRAVKMLNEKGFTSENDYSKIVGVSYDNNSESPNTLHVEGSSRGIAMLIFTLLEEVVKKNPEIQRDLAMMILLSESKSITSETESKNLCDCPDCRKAREMEEKSSSNGSFDLFRDLFNRKN